MSETKGTMRNDTSMPPMLREDLIQTAVKFLTHPNVLPRPLDQKKGFLTSKGLTEEEMQEAIARSISKTPAPIQPQAHISVPVPYQQYPVTPYISPFERIQRILHTLLLLGGLGYGIFWLYKTYIEPFLFGKKKPQSKPVEDRITDLEQTVKTSLGEIRVELGELGKSTSSATRTHEKLATFQQIREIQDNLSSVKGLLLSRQQFPPVPQVSPLKTAISIPSWQMSETSSSSADVENQVNSNETSTEMNGEKGAIGGASQAGDSSLT